MLSILITIYNYNLLPLVKELHRECLQLGIVFEILTQDDASNSLHNIKNIEINKLPHCSYCSLEENVGYRENKNILVSKSKYDILLILDGDCILPNANFIKNYIDHIDDFEVIYGGRIHAQNPPSATQLLRWKYGKFMEDQTVAQREKNTYGATLFNNTLIKKAIFNLIKFDSSFKKYGNDDTLFSFELQKRNVQIKHIYNPVQHDDIDTNVIYLEKTKHSLENLKLLYQKQLIPQDYSKMLRLTSKLHRYKLTYPLSIFYTIFGKLVENNLKGNNPSLLVFNVFRLSFFSKLYMK
ncbi:Glycosyl transferase family 2 [Flavobacterium micromati]|uniref:Glycosyl transferase family 2 n=1 Tax=Flavobacterium micromati TaxID=229205 RepID=A0A1M5H0H0_9FLAO|nr:glycosyltransferase family 2 protein [Flavobacterium micromati]SHG09483.1 Glycosyl transferase family 2 [Flavobacterium micromati]